MIRTKGQFVVCVLVLLLSNAAAFQLRSRQTSLHFSTTSLHAAKEDGNAKEEKKNPVKDFLKVLITGSPDGVAQFGKPQRSWTTGKPMTEAEQKKARTINWNALSSKKEPPKKK
mmetsp:Transcript_29496/g.49701  ORF Transcript_29496/g.49701 Transcript_29496/m.49701 type:complete len:114 (+) Transcript_29496:119-460(+)